MAFHIVIPARYGSTRFPGKPLALIAGRPLLQWVYERAQQAGAAEVLIATDDERIAAAAHGFSATVLMTASTHASGTDRIAEVARARRWSSDAIVVNVQGDEPLLPTVLMRQVADLLAAFPFADIATLAAPIRTIEEFLDPNAVKVVTDRAGRAMYFSRAPIPFPRDDAPGGKPSTFAGARRHIGMYAYRAGALTRLAAVPVHPLEDAEKLEQLRALAQGLEIRVADACELPGPDVNSPADLLRVEALMSAAAPTGSADRD